MGVTTPFPSPDAIARAELLTRERFVYEGESLEEALAPGSARRRALDAAAGRGRGRQQDAVDRVAARVLAAARARAAALRGGATPRRRHGALRPPGRRAVGHADRAARRGPAANGTAGQRRGRRTVSSPEDAVARRRDRRARPTTRRRGRGRRPRATSTTRTRTRTPRTRARGRGAAGLAGRGRRRRAASSTSSPRIPTPPSASGSSTPPAPARRSPRSASSRPRAPAAS